MGKMRVLLDTHALLWWFFDDPRLSAAAREVIADRLTEVLVSSASACCAGSLRSCFFNVPSANTETFSKSN